MKSLKLDNKGDIFFDNLGKTVWLDYLDKKAQSIKLRLSTTLGTLFYDEEYGLAKIKGKITLELVSAYINDALMKDEDIRDIEFISFKREVGAYKIEMNIYLFEEEEPLNIDINI